MNPLMFELLIAGLQTGSQAMALWSQSKDT